MVKFVSEVALVHRSNVAHEFNVHPRTITRWETDPTLAFPKSVVIKEQRYFKRAEIKAWREELFRSGLKAAIEDRRKGTNAETTAQPSDAVA